MRALPRPVGIPISPRRRRGETVRWSTDFPRKPNWEDDRRSGPDFRSCRKWTGGTPRTKVNGNWILNDDEIDQNLCKNSYILKKSELVVWKKKILKR